MNENIETLIHQNKTDPAKEADFKELKILQTPLSEVTSTVDNHPFAYYGRGWLHPPISDDEPQIVCLRLAGSSSSKWE